MAEMFNIAKKLAAKSQHHQHHHACIITKGGKIIATGYNHLTMHAEMDALRKVTTRFLYSGKVQKGLVLWSFRWRKNGTWGNAKPCERCMYWMKRCTAFVIDDVYFTNAAGQLERL
jgi:pyrimidine deaminase RibD-like protein